MPYLTYPFGPDGSGRTGNTEDKAIRVRNLLQAVLFTVPGERVMRPEFGSGVPDMLFDGNSEALETAADFLIRTAVQRYLSDVLVLEDLTITRDEGVLEINVTYALVGEEDRQIETFVRGVG
ncbi:Gene 25-like lysozyme [Roseovarius albus]|uniref:Gene 25-like lysozyme n=1 Tax=Roseovarius albus TaxID=1247867 RepID=A0A1X6ZSA4_9RHOB|nr:GPW/gp25 family protein [Roseovarius albus]SLN59740.1 Gene 25-like lysozyme [Roseovarius albus]